MGISLKKTISSLMIVAMLVCIIPCQVFAAGKTGWRKVGEEDYRYYITPTKYATGWKKINGYWYYFGKDGLRYHKLKNPGYTLDFGGRVIDDKDYYFTTSGKMRSSTWIWVEGLYHGYIYVKKDGTPIEKPGWHKVKGKWYYFIYSDGYCFRYDKNTVSSDFNRGYAIYKGHFINPNGSAKKKGWWNAGGKNAGGTYYDYWYYFKDNKGKAAKGWAKIKGKWYYFAPKEMTSSKQGYHFLKYMMVHDCSIKINGKKYKFNSKGVCTNP